MGINTGRIHSNSRSNENNEFIFSFCRWLGLNLLSDFHLKMSQNQATESIWNILIYTFSDENDDNDDDGCDQHMSHAYKHTRRPSKHWQFDCVSCVSITCQCELHTLHTETRVKHTSLLTTLTHMPQHSYRTKFVTTSTYPNKEFFIGGLEPSYDVYVQQCMFGSTHRCAFIGGRDFVQCYFACVDRFGEQRANSFENNIKKTSYDFLWTNRFSVELFLRSLLAVFHLSFGCVSIAKTLNKSYVLFYHRVFFSLRKKEKNLWNTIGNHSTRYNQFENSSCRRRRYNVFSLFSCLLLLLRSQLIRTCDCVVVLCKRTSNMECMWCDLCK